MGVAMVVRVTRLDVTAEDMRREAARSKDSSASRRMLALALVLEGKSRAEAAESCGMDRQTLRDWVYRFNELGLAGLTNKPHSGGPQARLTGSFVGGSSILLQGSRNDFRYRCRRAASAASCTV